MSERTASRDLEPLRDSIREHYLPDESRVVRDLLGRTGLDEAARRRAVAEAASMVETLRGDASPGLMESFLTEYGLTSKEGVALMCLAEALLRVPDEITIDDLIRDKIAPADWGRHLGHSSSPLVNASTWALMLTGKVIGEGEEAEWEVLPTLRGLVRRMGEPVIRTAVGQAMKAMGHQFVLGEGISEAMKRARDYEDAGYTYSYDMLGEAARTDADAQHYFEAYTTAIAAIAKAAKHNDVRSNPGISVKLSALHPRYEVPHRANVMAELLPRLTKLVRQAKDANIGLNIDAEEANRLDLSLDIIERVLAEPALAGWDGFGVVVQAYGPRAAPVLDWLHALAEKHDRKITVRLVKGAYWDTEIKNAQVLGLEAYPVFTRKASTDVCYLACARKLLDMRDRIYPQFATHNAHSAAAILEMAGGVEGYEFQRLHGMGEGLHQIMKDRHENACRIYAPVGEHRDLLAYLVRRLLENGANSSFVNQVVDEAVPVEEIVRDPIAIVEELDREDAIPNPKIPLPPDIYGETRRNAKGWDLFDPATVEEIDVARAPLKTKTWHARPLIAGEDRPGKARPVTSPQNRADEVGTVEEADATLAEEAVGLAEEAAAAWRERPADERAAVLERIADLYEEHAVELMAIASREAGKNLHDGVAEVREAVDFCRYYAQRARLLFAEGERQGRGVFVCISPWNFPLAIFTGQIVAALVTGNAVIAKPAEQTPLIAYRAAKLMHEAGVPQEVLTLLPGEGAEVGAALAADPRIAGVCFTGSTVTARAINRALAEAGNSDAVLIAETGGLNAMIVDSTALPEQAVRDIVISAFQSAGQRCSALRLLCVQEEVKPRIVDMLCGAMDAMGRGDPWNLSTDVGPVIDEEARDKILEHCERLDGEGRQIHKLAPVEDAEKGSFVPPAAYRLDAVEDLTEEIFGPILHVVTYKADDLEGLVQRINATGYGLTLGVHTRVDERVQRVAERAHVGNTYVNRNQIGAVVGVQPFGGEGLSGTGPKAGGPHYLLRFTAPSDEAAKPALPADDRTAVDAAALSKALAKAKEDQESWSDARDRARLLGRAANHLDGTTGRAFEAGLALAERLDFGPVELPGPTGESDQLSLHGRGAVLCLGGAEDGALARQIALALATGNGVAASGSDPRIAEALDAAGVPESLLQELEGRVTAEALERAEPLDAVVLEAAPEDLAPYRKALAGREGIIVPLIRDLSDPAQFVHERALCIDTTAAGGNATLLAAASAE